MIGKKRRSGRILGCLLPVVMGGSLLLASSAFGYVLKTPQLLDQTLKKLGRVSSLEVVQKHVYMNTGQEGEPVSFDETVWYLVPDRFRSDINGSDSRKVRIVSGDRALTIVDEAVVSEKEHGFDYYKDLFLLRNRILLRQRLLSLGINTETTRLDRYNGSIVFVIGDDDTHFETHPRLYIDKETFLPVRWILSAGTGEPGSDRMEVRYHKWKRFKRTYYPTRIECIKNGVTVKELRVQKVTLNPVLDEALFDIDVIKKEVTEKQKNAKTPPENGNDGDVRDTIDQLDDIINKDPLAF